MSDEKPSDFLTNTFDSLSNLIEGNEELVDSVFAEVVSLSDKNPLSDGGRYESRAGQDEPITELHVTEDILTLNAEADYITPSEVNLGFEGDSLYVTFEDRQVEINDAPDNIIIEEAQVFVNNGVLELQIPRGESIETSINETEEEL